MAKKFDSKMTKDGDVEYSSDAWNVADSFMKLKVLRLLILLDKYETISQYGVEEMEEKMMFSDNDIALKRKDGLNRFASTLRQLIGNVKFSIRKEDRPRIIDMEARIMTVENFLEDILNSKQNMITHENEMRINESHFQTCFRILRDIKVDINVPLNKAGLIFKQSEEVDLDAMMNQIISGG